ncbi:hypothetical protein GCM10007320_41240 [Pseudorhodoferax aquiterrae]|uniref:Zinc finger DksA/TraR C4-type domain-containing protein n=1 Tax=Pseudorhodoferax aquiterrae TaxID=747304 RepID=A0ABQ3G6X6_9BURK|nr:TraR/DksA family transcriptional regulator [Pseudorhodoferax aquiterrae]GHC91916.1 hypothetical protein GCM10007320_41240 [Pseudorhodoferax aquiterrae]
MTQDHEQDIADLGRRLGARRAELAQEVRTLDAETADATAQAAQSTTGGPHEPGDEGDRGEQAIRTAVRHAEKERDQQELQQIAQAQERMRSGDYGLCVDCGAPIAMERLQALPAAERCIACQERHERAHPGAIRISLSS